MHIIENAIRLTCEFLTKPENQWSFISISFLLTFCVFFAGYILIRYNKPRTWMILYVTAFSLFIAYKTNGMLMLLLPATAFTTWFLTKKIKETEKTSEKKIWLTLSIILNLTPLLYFKYTNFLIDTVNTVLQSNFALTEIILPVGISFYTFQAISYSMDVYRAKYTEDVNFTEFCFYLTFFPLLMAGPITRAGTLLPQIKRLQTPKSRMVYSGLWLIMTGLLKKGLIADYIAQYNNWIFDDPLAYSGFETAMGSIGYTLQIYCDFSGYSDFSIGLAAIMGFNLNDNFNFPYKSTNLTEFWHRWHISLSTWFRDYLYIPMGGNRKGKARTYLNNFITMLVAGLWHGASWMFVVWGGMHGAGLVVHKYCKRWLDTIPNTRIIKFVSWLLTFCYVSTAWVFFRAANMQIAGDIISHSIKDFSWDYLMPFVSARPFWTLFVILAFLLHFIPQKTYTRLKDIFIEMPWPIKLLILTLTVQLVITYSQANVRPFIYSQF